MKTFNRNTSGQFTGGMSYTGKGNRHAGRNGTRCLVVGGRKMKMLAERAEKRGTGKPVPVKVVKLFDGKTRIECKPEMVEFWKEKYPKAKIVA